MKKESGVHAAVKKDDHQKPTKEMWTKVWGDEFNDGQIDSSKWTFDLTNGHSVGLPGWGNNELQYYTNRVENVREEDGNLVIEARKEEYEGFGYTSARIKTKGLFSKKYGKFEIRASAPTGKGYWPAIWMLPEKNVYGGWAASGEIDIMEGWGSKPHTIAGTIHYGQEWPNNGYSGAEYELKDGKTIEDFHTYAIEWEPGEIRWYVDGELYSTKNDWYSQSPGQPANNAYPAPFDEEFHLIMNLAVGGNFDGNPDENTMFPKSMKIDYVRVYELTGREYREPVPPTIAKEDYLPDAKLAQEDGNLIYNNRFTEDVEEDYGMGIPGTAHWALYEEWGAGNNANVLVEDINNDRFLKVDIKNAGWQVYSVQPQAIVSLAKGRFYKLTFDAKAEEVRKMIVKVTGGASVGYASYSPSLVAHVTDEIQRYEIPFQMKHDSDNAARVEFNLGTNSTTTWIGNARLEEVESIPFNHDVLKTPLPNGNHVYNGGFDIGEANGMSYWHLLNSGKAVVSSNVDAEERKLKMDIEKRGKHASEIQLVQRGILISPDHDYNLSFDVQSSHKNEVEIQIVNQEGKVYGKEVVKLVKGEQHIELTFKELAMNVSDPYSQLVFQLGNSKGTIELDNIQLYKSL
ncbi:family 16 glycosylhydrolase [Metabacillus iocasae]|uniref:family 16 glycosylhydrolase n=1 Tax=Priestia iocasae TaxID=2291674 RepID=UPI00366FE869